MKLASVIRDLVTWFHAKRVLPALACVACVAVAARIAASAARQKKQDAEADFIQVCRDAYRDAVRSDSSKTPVENN